MADTRQNFKGLSIGSNRGCGLIHTAGWRRAMALWIRPWFRDGRKYSSFPRRRYNRNAAHVEIREKPHGEDEFFATPVGRRQLPSQRPSTGIFSGRLVNFNCKQILFRVTKLFRIRNNRAVKACEFRFHGWTESTDTNAQGLVAPHLPDATLPARRVQGPMRTEQFRPPCKRGVEEFSC